jgi:hypothetical protein
MRRLQEVESRLRKQARQEEQLRLSQEELELALDVVYRMQLGLRLPSEKKLPESLKRLSPGQWNSLWLTLNALQEEQESSGLH